MTAPAHGLVLWKVYYGKKPKPEPGATEADDATEVE